MVHITAVTVLLTALAWIVILATARDTQQIAAKDVEREVQVLTAVVAEQVSQAISAIDYTVSFVAEEFKHRREPDRLKRLVESGAVRMDNMVLLTVVDGNGRMVQTNRGPTPAATDLSDREHIRVHLNGSVKGLFIGKPVKGRESGLWSIQVTRAILDDQGRPTGVIVGSLDPHYFERFWRNASIPKGLHIEILGADGALRSINSDVVGTLQRGLVRQEIPEIFANLSRDGGHLPLIERSTGRITYFKQIGNLPLVLRTELELAKAGGLFNDLKSLNAYYVLLGIVDSCAILLLGWSLRTSTRRLIEKSEEAETARRQLQDAIEAVPEGFVFYDAEDRLAIMNEAYRRLYSCSDRTLRIGVKFEEVLREGAMAGQYAGVDSSNMEEFIQRRMELHKNPTGPFEQQVCDDRWIRIEEKRTADGGVVGFRSDITELKRRELALASQTALLSTTLEHMGEGLSVVDRNGRIVAFNTRFASLINRAESVALKGVPLSHLLAFAAHNIKSGDAKKAYQASLAAPGKPVEWTTCNGRIIELRTSLLPDGGAVTLYSDVTDERNAAQRIRSSEALKSAMFASSLDGIIIADETGIILEVNEAAEQIFGWRASDVIGRKIPSVIIPERLQEQHKEGLAKFLADRNSKAIGKRLELTAVDSEGREFPTEITIAVIDAGGRTRFSAFIRDISERKRVERQVQAAREAAEAASKAKTDFLAMVSHEFRTPMNGIVGLSELIRTTPLDDTQKRYLEGIEESSRRLMVLTTDILDFSRIEAGRLQIRPATFDLHAMVDRAVETTRALLSDKPVAVRSRIEGELPRFVVGDSNRLGQVLGNLLSNSAKFTERGQIEVCLRQRDEAREGSVRIHVEVRDTGPGIPAEMRERMFKPFEQANPEVTHHYGGSGLGLTICKRLMDLMGGEIGFTSELGIGTTVWIELELPVGTADQQSSNSVPLTLPADSIAKRVLVAEDTPTSRLVVRSMLEKLGHVATVASDGAQALKLASEQQFDLILMDIQMPVLDGIEAARRIRALPGSLGSVPIVAMSAQVLPATLERALEAGMNRHVPKPITLANLSAAIASVARAVPAEATAVVEPVRSATAVLEELKEQVGEQALVMLVQQFSAECSELFGEMARLIEGRDSAQLRRVAHKLLGLLGQFGCERPRAIAEEIELAADDAEVYKMSSALVELGPQALHTVAEAMGSARDSSTSAETDVEQQPIRSVS